MKKSFLTDIASDIPKILGIYFGILVFSRCDFQDILSLTYIDKTICKSDKFNSESRIHACRRRSS